MVQEWELAIIGEALTGLLERGTPAPTVMLLRRLADDYGMLAKQRVEIREILSTIQRHTRAPAHARCLDCNALVHKALAKASKL